MNRKLVSQLKALSPGCLLRVDWWDASTGKTVMSGPVDIPVTSWGVFVCLFGERNQYIILAQNNFRMSEHLYDIDYTAIPVAWTTSFQVLNTAVIKTEEADKLLHSFVAGARRRGQVSSRAQMRAVNGS